MSAPQARQSDYASAAQMSMGIPADIQISHMFAVPALIDNREGQIPTLPPTFQWVAVDPDEFAGGGVGAFVELTSQTEQVVNSNLLFGGQYAAGITFGNSTNGMTVTFANGGTVSNQLVLASDAIQVGDPAGGTTAVFGCSSGSTGTCTFSAGAGGTNNFNFSGASSFTVPNTTGSSPPTAAVNVGSMAAVIGDPVQKVSSSAQTINSSLTIAGSNADVVTFGSATTGQTVIFEQGSSGTESAVTISSNNVAIGAPAGGSTVTLGGSSGATSVTVPTGGAVTVDLSHASSVLVPNTTPLSAPGAPINVASLFDFNADVILYEQDSVDLGGTMPATGWSLYVPGTGYSAEFHVALPLNVTLVTQGPSAANAIIMSTNSGLTTPGIPVGATAAVQVNFAVPAGMTMLSSTKIQLTVAYLPISSYPVTATTATMFGQVLPPPPFS